MPLAFEQPSGASDFRRRYPDLVRRARPLRVLFLGQINLRKGIVPILDAVRLLRDEPIEFTLARPRFQSRPIFVTIPSELAGHRTATIRLIYSTGKPICFCFPTFSDGFGLTQLEAQAWRLPIVTTRFCGKVVEDEKNGWVLRAVTPDAIVQAIRRAPENPKQLQEMSACAVPAEAFSLDQVGRQWLDVFD